MGATPAFASIGEAMEAARAALGYLATADATALAAETQAECLQGLERAEAVLTAARASVLSAFTAGKGYSADADYSATAWLMHKTGITRGAAASHTAWGKRFGTHPKVVAALAARGRRPGGWGWRICRRCSPSCTSGPGPSCPMRTRTGPSPTGGCGWRRRSRARAL